MTGQQCYVACLVAVLITCDLFIIRERFKIYLEYIYIYLLFGNRGYLISAQSSLLSAFLEWLKVSVFVTDTYHK